MKDLTQGSTTKIILALAIPIAASSILQTLYLLVDLYFIASLGEDSIAGVGLVSTLGLMITALTSVVGASVLALVSQAVGRKDKDEANVVFNQSLALSLVFSIVTLVLGYLVADDYLISISANEGALEEGIVYLWWLLPGMSVQFAVINMTSSLRATGVVKPVVLIQAFSVVLNIILTPILIAGWGPGAALGVKGAALASTISIVVGVILLILYFFKLEKYVSIQTKLWKPRFDILKHMLDIGLPAGGSMLLLFIYFSVSYWLIKDFGASAQAGFTIGSRITQTIFLLMMALGFAVGPIIGQNYGAGLGSRVRETFYNGIILSSLAMIFATLMLQWQPKMLVAFFTDDESVIAIGSVYLQLISWNFVAQGIVFTCTGVFLGLGNTRPSLLSSAVRLLLFIPPAVILKYQPGFTINHVWYISIASVIGQAVLSFFLVHKELISKLNNCVDGKIQKDQNRI